MQISTFDIYQNPQTFNGVKSTDIPRAYDISKQLHTFLSNNPELKNRCELSYTNYSYVTGNIKDKNMVSIVKSRRSDIFKIRQYLSNLNTKDLQKYRPNAVLAY